jgi:hypothetical protein
MLAMRQSVLLLIPLMLLRCAVVSSLQTPDVQKPGGVVIGAGVTSEPGITRTLSEEGMERPSLSQSKLFARIGVLPRIEVGVQMSGVLVGFGIDSKIQLLRRPVLIAFGAGYGKSKIGYCLTGCTNEEVTTRHTSLLIGRGRVYGALTLMDYAHMTEGDHQTRTSMARLVPGMTAGLMQGRGRVRGLGEVNVYFFESGALSFSGGVQVRLGRQ